MESIKTSMASTVRTGAPQALKVGAVVVGVYEPRKLSATAEALDKAGVVVVASTPEQFGAHIKNEVAKAGKIIKAANIKAD